MTFYAERLGLLASCQRSRIPGYRPRFSRCCVNSGSRVVPWSTSAATADISGGFGDGRFQSGRCRRLCTGVGARGGNHAASGTTLRGYQRLYVCICAHGNGARRCYVLPNKKWAPCVEEQHRPRSNLSRAGTGRDFRHRGHDPRKPVSIPKSPCRTRLTYQPRRARKPRRGTALSGYCHRSPGRRPMAAVP